MTLRWFLICLHDLSQVRQQYLHTINVLLTSRLILWPPRDQGNNIMPKRKFETCNGLDEVDFLLDPGRFSHEFS